jgi:RNA polymerase sigma-70 factor (ECF subfamily)
MIQIGSSEPTLVATDFTAVLSELRQGNEDAWRQVVSVLRPVLKDVARGRLPARIGHRADASDVVQETLAEAAKSLHRFEGDSLGQFVSWLNEILRHDTCDAVRRHLVAEVRSVRREAVWEPTSASDAFVEECLVAEQPTPSGHLSRIEQAQRLYRALEQLPARQRIAVQMKHLENKTLAEIGEVLGCNSGAAAQLVARGIRAINLELAERL